MSNKPDMERVIQVLISLLEEQEHVEITYTIEKEEDKRLGGRKEDKPMRVRDWIVVGLLMNGLPMAMFLHWLVMGY